jgi:glycosyltransferase 2 family protein
MAKIAFAAALIYWMVHKGVLDFHAIAKLASPAIVTFCVVCVFLQIYVSNYRWLVLLRAQGFASTIRETLQLTLIGMFFNFFMPGGVGGDVVKGYYLLQDHPTKKFAGAVSIFMDRMIGFFMMIATAFVAIFFSLGFVMQSREVQSIAVGVAVLFLGFFVFYFLSLSRLLQGTWMGKLLFHTLPGGGKIHRLYEVLHSYRNSPRALVIATLMSVLNQLLMIAFVYVIGQALGADIPLRIYCFLVPLGSVVQALPLSPAGIGVGQAAFLFLFNLYLGGESILGPTAVTAAQASSFFWGIVGAFFYLQRKKPVFVAEPLEAPAPNISNARQR